MSDVQLLKVRLRADQAEGAIRWIRGLAGRGPEMARLIALEGLTVESLFLERDGDRCYLYQYARAPDLRAAHAAFMADTTPLSEETRRQIAATWEAAVALEPLGAWERTPAGEGR